MSTPLINKFVVVGIGLIGGSLATGLKQRGVCAEVIGIARKQDTCSEAVERGVVDRAYTSIRAIASELSSGDVIFISVPTLAVNSVFEEIKNFISPDVTIT